MNLKQIVKSVLFLAIGIFAAYWSIRKLTQEQITEIISAIKSFPVYLLVLVSIIGLLPHYIRAIRWRMLLKEEAEKTTNLDLFAAVMVGYIANLAFPRLGEVSRCGVLKNNKDVDFTFSLGTVFFERILDVICLFLVVVICFFVEFKAMNEFIYENFINKYAEKFNSIPWFVYPIVIIAFVAFAFWIFKNRKKILNPENKIIKFLLSFKDGLLEVKNVKNPILFIVYTVSIWVLYLLIIYIAYFGFTEMKSLHFGSSISLLVAGTVAMVVVQGGIGVYPILIAGVLHEYGISQEISNAFGWLVWTLQTFIVVIIGGLSFGYFAINKKQEA